MGPHVRVSSVSDVALAEAEEAEAPVEEARAALRAAFASRTKAAAALEKARAATIRAKALVGEQAAEVEKHVHAGKRVTARRTDDLKVALKAGKAPSFEVLAEVPALAAKRAEAESRLEAARGAEAELKADEATAASSLSAAEANVVSARTDIVLAEAQGIAERIEDLEAEAAELREQIGLGSYALGRILGASLTPALARAMSGQNWLTNGFEQRRALAHSVQWQDFYNRLASNPDAELSFDPPAAAEATGLRMLSN